MVLKENVRSKIMSNNIDLPHSRFGILSAILPIVYLLSNVLLLFLLQSKGLIAYVFYIIIAKFFPIAFDVGIGLAIADFKIPGSNKYFNRIGLLLSTIILLVCLYYLSIIISVCLHYCFKIIKIHLLCVIQRWHYWWVSV